MVVETVIVGPLETNCYILGDESSGEAILIDPGAAPQRIKSCLKKTGLRLKCIVNTHGHADHIGANGAFGVPVWIHTNDAEFLVDSHKNLSVYLDGMVTSPAASRLLLEGDVIEIGSINLQVLHTPGHTPGGICLKFILTEKDEKCFVFTGDTLFGEGGIGRTDFPFASSQQLWTSIREKLFVLADETVIYPGHGPSSTIGREKIAHGY